MVNNRVMNSDKVYHNFRQDTTKEMKGNIPVLYFSIMTQSVLFVNKRLKVKQQKIPYKMFSFAVWLQNDIIRHTHLLGSDFEMDTLNVARHHGVCNIPVKAENTSTTIKNRVIKNKQYSLLKWMVWS